MKRYNVLQGGMAGHTSVKKGQQIIVSDKGSVDIFDPEKNIFLSVCVSLSRDDLARAIGDKILVKETETVVIIGCNGQITDYKDRLSELLGDEYNVLIQALPGDVDVVIVTPMGCDVIHASSLGAVDEANIIKSAEGKIAYPDLLT